MLSCNIFRFEVFFNLNFYSQLVERYPPQIRSDFGHCDFGRAALPVSTFTKYIFTTAMRYKQTCVVLSVYLPVKCSLMALVNQTTHCSLPQTLRVFFSKDLPPIFTCALTHRPARNHADIYPHPHTF